MNYYPAWKNLLIVAIVAIGLLYASPNLYGEDPVVQISPTRGALLDDAVAARMLEILRDGNVEFRSLERGDGGATVVFGDTEQQLRGQDLLQRALGTDYIVALNLMPAAPEWMRALNAAPMYLGLDLRGGVHFLMEVDMDAAVTQAEERYVDDLRQILRDERIRYLSIGRASGGGVEVRFRTAEDRDAARGTIRANDFGALSFRDVERDDGFYLFAELGDAEIREIKRFAIEQNVITLRNRVNELGVAEPVIQRQGDNRIVVQLPGVQDPARAKEILGATATLEFRMADESGDVQSALEGRVPVNSRLYRERNGNPVLLDRRIIVTGDQIINAASGIDSQSGSPAVFITLDSVGARRMLQTTRDNIGRPMAVVFIERKPETRLVDGEIVRSSRTIEEVINIATIRDQFSRRFQITGLASTEESHNLALLLRAGALAAPIEIVEERTIGPSLGQDNIDQGFLSVIIGFLLVLVYMAVRYKVFGMVANLALLLNLVIIVAVLSMLQATLTLPGIAGIVLTVGMAVDANVLIFERIREELRNGNSPQASIKAGYERAMTTIADSNITTLIAAGVLYGFGTGPIKGFAITLSIGILTSMFTAIMGTRMVINLIYGRRKLGKLVI